MDDRLSDLPLNTIETILCLVPIQEAGRTSILSKEWRYRWTRIPKLVFDEKTFQVSTVVDGMDKKTKLICAVGQVLLMHDGPIHEFTLSLLQFDHSIEIDHIITHLSTRTSIKKLTLDFQLAGYMIPSSIFSFHQLTHMCLIGGCFDHQPTFNEFASLTSLILRGVYMPTITVQHLLSKCPLVKTLRLEMPSLYISESNDGTTSMSDHELTVTKILEYLPVIETLTLWLPVYDVFEDSAYCVPIELLTPLFPLKYLEIYNVCFTRKHEFTLTLLIKNSPNLEKLMIVDSVSWTLMESSNHRYPGIMLEHLKELEIYDFVYNKARLDFVKFILARSPLLKKVKISLDCRYRDERFQILKFLLGYSRASPEVQIIV